MQRNAKKRTRADAGVDFHEPEALYKSKRQQENDVSDIL